VGAREAMSGRVVRLAIAGGGTGGHVLPALAVLEELRERGVAVEPVWIGSRDGVEREAAARAGVPFRSIQAGKLRRYLDWRTPVDAARLPLGVAQAWRHLRAHRPDVVFSTGGFVSVPTVVAAARLAPILTHEQTATLGLATRINLRFADRLAVSWECSLRDLNGQADRAVVTGNPVRASLAGGLPARCRERFGFSADLPVLYVTGGARGASPLNQRIGALLPALLESCQVLHQTGPATANPDAEVLRRRRAEWSPELQRRYQIVEFVGDELADVYAAADLILGRAGAGTVAELASFGLPAVLIPLPGTGGDEQTRNARLLADAGGAMVISQEEATPVRLDGLLRDLLSRPEELARMGNAARSVGRIDAAARLADELLDLAGS
jgi:UDP-N-acetylglucosamine--N-acetylmuramyl-(pentapeptide) pyrophosphoryl-undecaprenol N-acetylglucosamine transferase